MVFDLKPGSPNVSLYRLKDLWGYSYDIYTPIALRLECLFHDKQVGAPGEVKRKFTDENFNGTILAEFLYINGGTHRDRWSWGLAGRVNGALLWREAFSYFVSELNDTLDDRNVGR